MVGSTSKGRIANGIMSSKTVILRATVNNVHIPSNPLSVVSILYACGSVIGVGLTSLLAVVKRR